MSVFSTNACQSVPQTYVSQIKNNSIEKINISICQRLVKYATFVFILFVCFIYIVFVCVFGCCVYVYYGIMFIVLSILVSYVIMFGEYYSLRSWNSNLSSIKCYFIYVEFIFFVWTCCYNFKNTCSFWINVQITFMKFTFKSQIPHLF